MAKLISPNGKTEVEAAPSQVAGMLEKGWKLADDKPVKLIPEKDEREETDEDFY